MLDLFIHIAPFMLAMTRLSGIFLLAPIFASTTIPSQARALLVVALSAAIYPMIPPEQVRPLTLDIFTLAWALGGEMLIGFCIGLLMMMPLAAVQLSGMLMGNQMGFGLAQVYNPALESDTDLLGDLLSYIALGVFLVIGGLEATFLAVASSFKLAPLGSIAAGAAPVELIAGVLGSGFEMALRVSLPVMAIILMETIANAFIAKTLPQMNIASIGFAIKIVLGLGVIVVSLRAMQSVMGEHVSVVGRMVLDWAASGVPRPVH